MSGVYLPHHSSLSNPLSVLLDGGLSTCATGWHNGRGCQGVSLREVIVKIDQKAPLFIRYVNPPELLDLANSIIVETI